MTFIEKLRNSRQTPQKCYLEYNKIRQKRPQAFIAFLEGYDAPYYLPIIALIDGQYPEQVICGNKKNVIGTHDSLKAKKELSKAKTGFFIDRDYDDNSNIQHRIDYFITKGYSVENYYCSQTVFERILKCYMHYNCAHPDYDALVSNYTYLQLQYNNVIIEFNGWYCALKRNEVTVEWSLDEKMPKGYVVINIELFKIEKKYSLTKIHQNFKAKPQPSTEDVLKWSKWIMQDAVYNMRGKFEFQFLISYLSSLQKMVKNPANAFEDHSMNFSLSQKEALSALAQYAERDDDLDDYIRKRIAY